MECKPWTNIMAHEVKGQQLSSHLKAHRGVPQAQALISQPKDVKHWMLKHIHLASNIKAQAPIAAPQGCLGYRIHYHSP